MIIEAINTKPFIHLGFGKQEITVYKDEEIIVWQDKIYFDYAFAFSAFGSTLVSENINKLVIKYTTDGIKTINVTVDNKGKGVNIKSNTVTVNVLL